MTMPRMLTLLMHVLMSMRMHMPLLAMLLTQIIALPAATLAFGSKPLQDHLTPDCYGAVEPTAVCIPLETILGRDEAFKIALTEL